MTEPQQEDGGRILREPFLDAIGTRLAAYTGANRERVLAELRRSSDPARTASTLMLDNLDRFLQPSGDPLVNPAARSGLQRRLRETRAAVGEVLAAEFAPVVARPDPRTEGVAEGPPARLVDDLAARAAGEAAFGRAVAVAHPALLECGEPTAVRAELLHRLDAMPEPPGLPEGRSVRGPQLRDELGRVSRHASAYTKPADWGQQTFATGDMIRVTHALEIDAAGPGWTALPAWQARSEDPSVVMREGIRSEWAGAAAPGVTRRLGLAEFVPGVDTAPPPAGFSIESAAERLVTRIHELTGIDRPEVLNSMNSAGPGDLDQWTQAARMLGPGLPEQAQAAVATTMRDSFGEGLRQLPEIDRIEDWGRLGTQVAERGGEHARMLTEAGRGFAPVLSASQQAAAGQVNRAAGESGNRTAGESEKKATTVRTNGSDPLHR